MNTWTIKKNGYTRKLPFYEVHHAGKYLRFSGKTKAEAYARSIGQNLFNQYNGRIDIVNTQTGEITKFQ